MLLRLDDLLLLVIHDDGGRCLTILILYGGRANLLILLILRIILLHIIILWLWIMLWLLIVHILLWLHLLHGFLWQALIIDHHLLLWILVDRRLLQRLIGLQRDVLLVLSHVCRIASTLCHLIDQLLNHLMILHVTALPSLHLVLLRLTLHIQVLLLWLRILKVNLTLIDVCRLICLLPVHVGLSLGLHIAIILGRI